MEDNIDTTTQKDEPTVSPEVEQLTKVNEQLAQLTQQNQQLTEQNQMLASQFQQLAELGQQQQTAQQQPESWQPKTWDEVKDTAEKTAQTAAEKVYEEKQAEAQRLEAEKAAKTSQVDQYLDKQLEELEKEGVIPKIKNKDDATDAGRLARQELFGFAARAETTNLKHVAATLKELHDAGKHFEPQSGTFVNSKKQPAGANAPIGSSSQRGGGQSGGITYKEIHGARDLDALIARFEKTH